MSNPSTRPEAPAAVEVPPLNLATLQQQLHGLLHHEQLLEQQRLSLLRLLLALTNGAGAAFISFDAEQQAQLGLRILSQQALTWHEQLEQLLLSEASNAQQQQQLQLKALDAQQQRWVLTTPLQLSRGVECVSLVLRTGQQPLELFAIVLQLLAGYTPLLHAEQSHWQWLLNLQLRLLQSGDLTQAGQVLCEQLQQQFQCQRVLFGLQRGHHCRLQAGSELANIQRQADLVQAVEALMDVTRQVGEVLSSQSLDRHPAIQKVLNLSNAQTVLSVPLAVNEKAANYVLVLWWAPPHHSSTELLPFIAPSLAITLQACQQQQLSGWARLRQRWQRLGQTWQRLFWLAVPFVLIAVLLVPVPHRLEGQVTLQPSVRRFVTAPFAGILKHTVHEAGDVVSAGTVLAVMDAQEIEWTLKGLEAERNRLRKQKDASAAARDTAAAQVAQLEIERVEAQIALQNYRAANLEIKSPIDGIVLTGDLKRVEGSPLNAGQSLFEIAPLSDMVSEIALPATVIPYVQLSLPLEFNLNAYPYETWALTVERIHPRAEVRDGATVFIAEASLSNPEDRLRPGMKGKGYVIAEQRALGWVLFHQVWEQVWRWLR